MVKRKWLYFAYLFELAAVIAALLPLIAFICMFILMSYVFAGIGAAFVSLLFLKTIFGLMFAAQLLPFKALLDRVKDAEEGVVKKYKLPFIMLLIFRFMACALNTWILFSWLEDEFINVLINSAINLVVYIICASIGTCLVVVKLLKVKKD